MALNIQNNLKEEDDMSRYLKIFFGYTDATYVNGSFIEEEVKNEAVTCGKDGFVISDDRN